MKRRTLRDFLRLTTGKEVFFRKCRLVHLCDGDEDDDAFGSPQPADDESWFTDVTLGY